MSSMPWADKLQERIDELEEQLAEAQVKAERAEEQLAEARAVLSQTQYGMCDMDGDRWCVFCSGQPRLDHDEHDPDCRLAAILKETG